MTKAKRTLILALVAAVATTAVFTAQARRGATVTIIDAGPVNTVVEQSKVSPVSPS